MDDSLLTTPDGRHWLEGEILPVWMPQQRWFGGKARSPQRYRLFRQVALGPAWLFGVEVTYADGETETYLLPLMIGASSDTELARLKDGRGVHDATEDAEFRVALFRLMADGASEHGLVGEAGSYLQQEFTAGVAPASRVLKAEQSNTSLIYGEKLFVKLYRKLVEGVNPDAEITRHLSEQAGFAHIPGFGGTISWDGCSVALATAVVSHEGDAWGWACANAEQAFRAMAAQHRHFADTEFLDEDAAMEDGRSTSARQLGLRTGEMHLALAKDTAPAFEPEPWNESDARELAAGLRTAARETIEGLVSRAETLPANCAPLLEKMRDSLTAWNELADAVEGLTEGGVKIRTHGDYHLGQVLLAAEDFVILDFEGEPLRSLAERRAKRSPLRDVAGMLRSFHYAAHFAARKCGCDEQAVKYWVEGKAQRWQSQFLKGWRQAVAARPLAISYGPSERLLLKAFVGEKAFYEVRYELNNRPDWVDIPLRSLATLCGDASAPENDGFPLE